MEEYLFNNDNYDFSEVDGKYDFTGVYPKDEGSYEYDFSEVEGKYDFFIY